MNYIKAKTISELWYFAIVKIYKEHYKTDIDRGSFEKEEQRFQLPFISGEIEFPLYDMIPHVPFGISQPTNIHYIEKYFQEKIIGSKKDENEEYTYGERIMEQLPTIIEILSETPRTNQAIIEVGKPSDIELPDPPCLRLLTFKITPESKLNITCFFRSWECYFGLPSNLGGIALLMEYVAGFLENVKTGKIFFASDGLHIYRYSWIDVEAIASRFIE